MQQKNILVTGAAGFIGSNLVESLLADKRVGKVRALDNLSTGKRSNLEKFEDHPRFEFLEGDIRNSDTCHLACQGIDLVSHQAALGSVPRSIADPATTNAVNIGGTLNVFLAAKDAQVERVVFAASSSTYGDADYLPKTEDRIGAPMSPYAVTKLVNELYAKVFADIYGIPSIGLRYFNVFGPNQDPNGAYAAVIPLFAKAIIEGKSPIINGDGSFSRDFTYIDNVVQANKLALFSEKPEALNQIYNIACGDRTTLNQLYEALSKEIGVNIEPIYGPNRSGDIPHSLADISKAKALLTYEPSVSVQEGIKNTTKYYQKLFSSKPELTKA